MNTQHDITVSGKPLNPPKPPAKPHMLLWIDTETTGLDPNQCELLEVGMQVTDLKAETRGDSLHLIVHPDNVRNWTMHPEMLKAYEMHLANGLMLACAEAPKTGYDYKHTALNIHEFLNDQLSQYTLHPAGTNVDFDLRQLDVHLSRHLEHPITQGLHHRKLDLTTLRLADQAIGGNPYQNHAGTHRVQDCIRRDINDYANYLDNGERLVTQTRFGACLASRKAYMAGVGRRNTDREIDAAALAVYTGTSGMGFDEVEPLWSELNPDVKERYRFLARLAIVAARTEALK